MLARIKGARLARGDVLVFLDAHCEAGTDWMRPLLERIKHKRDSVLTPIIDVVDQSTFKFEAPDSYQVAQHDLLRSLFTVLYHTMTVLFWGSENH